MKPTLKGWLFGASALSLAAFALFASPLLAQPRIRIDNISVSEGGAGTSQQAALNLTLTAASDAPVTVALGSSPGSPAAAVGSACGGAADYLQPSGTVRFEPGVVSQRIEVTVCGDATDEADEIFRVDLLDPVGATLADLRGRITILDDDPSAASLPTMSIGDVTVVEGDGDVLTRFEARFPVSLSASNAGIVSATFRVNPTTATVDSPFGTCGPDIDVVPTFSTVQFASGTTSVEAIIRICPDDVDEADETFQVVLSNPFRATFADSVAVGTIIDDDAPAALPTLSIRDVRIVEGTGSGEDTVRGVGVILSAASDQLVTADITYNVNAPNNATQGTFCAPDVDFTVSASTVRILPGGVFLNSLINIFPCRDDVDEPDETFQVELSNPVGATLADRLATVTIVDDDLGTVVAIQTLPTISIGDVSVDEGGSAVFALTLSRVPTETVSVRFATAPGTARSGTRCGSFPDYLARGQRVSFPAGGTGQVIVVPVCFDLSAESSETFTVTLSSPVNATIDRAVGTGTIR